MTLKLPANPHPAPKPKEPICSFCGKGANEVTKLIAGPAVYICDECVDLCNDIIKEAAKSDPVITREQETHDLLKLRLEYAAGFLAECFPSSPRIQLSIQRANIELGEAIKITDKLRSVPEV